MEPLRWLSEPIPGFPASPLDVIALVWFLFAWASYARYADAAGTNRLSLLKVMTEYRLRWMRQMLRRDNRIVDATMIGNLLRSISFFASTTILIVIGLMTLLGYRDTGTEVIESIPFVALTSPFMWEFKIFVLVIIFIYAFFKYTWSLRQYNYSCILVAAAPFHNELTARHEEYAQKAAKVVANAARHFNQGLRAYYFGLAALSWFIHAWAFLVITTWVVYVVYRREFRSHTLNNLANVLEE